MATKPVVPLLNFDIDNRPRQVIAIDGTHYPLRRGDDLSIDTSRELGRLLKTYADLNVLIERKGQRLARATKAQLDTVMKDLCRIIIAAPPAVLHKLTPVMRFRTINVFLTLSLTSRLNAAKAMDQAGQISDRALSDVLSGKTSSPSSAGSSAATRSIGSRGTRSRSSGSTRTS
jgi:hypothetical protein